MEDKYKKLLGSINIIEPPKSLENKIRQRIAAEGERLAKIKLWIFGSSSVASFGSLVWTAIYLVQNFKQTGFWQYVSLAFAENGVILKYWREFSLSLVESLPIFGLILFFSAFGFFVWSTTKTLSKSRYSINYKLA